MQLSQCITRYMSKPTRVFATLLLLLGVPCASAQPYLGEWSPLDRGLGSTVYAALDYDDGSGPSLFLGGSFINGAPALLGDYIIRWDGAAFRAVGSAPPNGTVHALAVYDDGSGPALYAAGAFTSIDGIIANRIAKWNGTSWSRLGSGLRGGAVPDVYALAVFDDGNGPELYAAGRFTRAGSQTVQNIAKWNGSAWSALSTGTTNGEFRALAVHDDGNGPGGGPSLFAGGTFTVNGGTVTPYLARWKSGAWYPVGFGAAGSGTNGKVMALVSHTDLAGNKLYIGGLFTAAGTTPAAHVASWDGFSFGALGSGMVPGGFAPGVRALFSFDYDSSGINELYAGGDFSSAGGVSAMSIARWDGANWSALLNPYNAVTGTNGTVEAIGGLAVAAANGAPGLFAGGWFGTAGNTSAAHVARYACECPIDLAPPYCMLDFFDILAFLNLFSSSNPAVDYNADGIVDFFDVMTYLQLYSAGCP